MAKNSRINYSHNCAHRIGVFLYGLIEGILVVPIRVKSIFEYVKLFGGFTARSANQGVEGVGDAPGPTLWMVVIYTPFVPLQLLFFLKLIVYIRNDQEKEKLHINFMDRESIYCTL